MSSNTILVHFPIRKPSGKLIKSDVLPITLCHPMHYPHIVCLLNEQRGIKLGYNLYVPIIVKAHMPLDVMTLTCNNNLIKNGIMLLGHMLPIHPLSPGYYPPLYHDHSLI
jgi:hypothetical protein